MTTTRIEWYLEFRRFGFSPRQANAIAKRISAPFTVAWARVEFGSKFEHFMRTASP